MFLFLLFIIFGISFLGAFEINLPASWSNKIDSKAGVGSYSGIFFMALTLVIVSFSCTGNFVASLLGSSTAAGKIGTRSGNVWIWIWACPALCRLRFLPLDAELFGEKRGMAKCV